MDNDHPRRLDAGSAPDERYEQFVDKWALEIGRFMLAFGSIESTTIQALRELPREPIAQALTKLTLGDRINLLTAVLRARNDFDCNSLAKVLLQIQELAHKRNLIAHNSVGIDIYMRADSADEYEVDESIRSEKNREKFLRLPELIEHRRDAEALARSVYFHYRLVQQGSA